MLRICAWIETSRAETGSSATISFGFEAERAGEADALALATGELVRVELDRLAGETDLSQQLARPAPLLGPRPDPLDRERLAEDRCRRACGGRARRRGPGT